jgi:hypothetical protein
MAMWGQVAVRAKALMRGEVYLVQSGARAAALETIVAVESLLL